MGGVDGGWTEVRGGMGGGIEGRTLVGNANEINKINLIKKNF